MRRGPFLSAFRFWLNRRYKREKMCGNDHFQRCTRWWMAASTCAVLCFAVLCCAEMCNSVSKFLFSNIFHLISFLIWCSLPIYWLQHRFRISKSSRCALEIFYWIFNSLLQCNIQFFRFISNSNFSIATAEKFLFLKQSFFFHALVNFWRISIDSLIDFFLLVLILQDS